MSSDPSLLDQCFDRVLREAPGLLGRCLSATVASLQEAENQSREVAQRDLISRAWWSLERQRPLMGTLFPQRLAHGLEQVRLAAARGTPQIGGNG